MLDFANHRKAHFGKGVSRYMARKSSYRFLVKVMICVPICTNVLVHSSILYFFLALERKFNYSKGSKIKGGVFPMSQ